MRVNVVDYSTANPYQEFSYTIAAGEFTEIRVPYNFFRILSLSNDTLSVKFGGFGVETPFSGAFLGLSFKYVYDRLTLKNTGLVDLDIVFAIGIGDIWDDRNNDPLPTSVRSNQPAVGALGSTLLSGGGKPIIIGAGASDLYIGTVSVTTGTGFLLRANQQLPPTNFNGNIYGIRTAGSAAAYVLEFN